jgi:tripartite-type tricarboxylate transporter receptor subunit TctC
MKHFSVVRRLVMACALQSVLCAPAGALARSPEKFPSKRVTLIVPFAAGGTLDVLARHLGRELEAKWAVPVIVENRPGASEVRGVQQLLAAPADGHTLLVAGALSFTLNRLSFEQPPYDADKLRPVTRMFNMNLGLLVPGDSPYKSFADFVAASRRDQPLLFGSAGGKGGQVHMAFLDVVAESGARLDFVPYNGTAPALQDLIGRRVDAMLAGVAPPIGPHLQNGTLKGLAIGGSVRSRSYPAIPTFRELGYAHLSTAFYTALAVPTGTPEAVVEQIADDVRAILQQPQFVQERLEPHGIEVVADRPAEFAAFLAKDLEIKRERLRSAGLLAAPQAK